jgi:hypothetical protein
MEMNNKLIDKHCLHELCIGILSGFGRMQWYFVFELPVLPTVLIVG